jgi:predicted nuclease of predicted toxin-antitoxin system
MADDVDIAEHAAANGLTVLTRDLDFPALLALGGRTTPSVVLLREEDRFEPVLVARLPTALRSLAEELAAGAIVSIAGNRLRVRRLPIGREGTS